MAGPIALWATVTGAGMARPACSPAHPGRTGRPACCSSCVRTGPSTPGPGDRRAAPGTATSPRPAPRCVRRPRSVPCRRARRAFTACSTTITAAGPIRPWSLAPTAAFGVRAASQEAPRVAWVPVDQVGSLPLHPGFAVTWPVIREAVEPVTIIVDAANVIGSRPTDGGGTGRGGGPAGGELAGLAGRGITAAAGRGGGPARWTGGSRSTSWCWRGRPRRPCRSWLTPTGSGWWPPPVG